MIGTALKRNLITICLIAAGLIVSFNLNSQINWMNNFDAAKAAAKKSGKLIVIDFWAASNGSCTTMDYEMWNKPEMKEYAKNFVALRVNVDIDKYTTSFYTVDIIPRVIVASASGDIIWENEGYINAEPYFSIFRVLPANVMELNNKYITVSENKKDLNANYSMALELRNTGKSIQYKELKNAFLNNSGKYLNAADKLCKDPVLKEEIALNSALNDVYYDRPQKALKQLEKMELAQKDENLAEFRHFVLAKCYKSLNDQENYLKEKQMVKKAELLAQLEE
jgi:thioredoxin-related protein